ncbi:MAG: MaoC family dehydratase N-terminal domain-containing protein, partial [Gammaproteobacteria bacterium]|nr:MaoC family dehydratase N-terminal domain-containing protein [Gammaproteobacteria bacterium]
MSTSWQQWIGRKQLASDCISKSPLLAMRSTLEGILGCPEEQTVPPLWHWLYFLDKPPQTQLAQDGHEKRGKYMPPITLPRRMWAASQLQFLLPLKVDDLVTRESVINSIETKQGKSGALAFVTIDHKISAESGLAIIEKQTIVYRGQAAGKPARKKVTEKADFEKTVNPTIL